MHSESPRSPPADVSTRSPAARLPGFEAALYDLDIGSAGGARWSGDDSSDPLARDVQGSIGHLVCADEFETPNGTMLGGGLFGMGHRTPSLTWHAQAIASLVELGFTPTAPCLWPHLDVIEARLTEGNYFDPGLRPTDGAERRRIEGWQLRCRHLSWIVKCMAEYQPIGSSSHHAGSERPEMSHAGEAPDPPRWNDERYRNLLKVAYDGLVGSPNARESPSAWVAPRRDQLELFWHEMWPTRDDRVLERRPNILSTVYSILALCRAERHGFGHYQSPWHALVHNEQTPSALVDYLLTQVVVRCGVGGPSVVLRDQSDPSRPPPIWTEPWARLAHTLPASVVGLLALTFVEYARFLAQISPASDRAQVRNAFLKAQRLAHALIARPAFTGVLWSRAADGFFQYGEDRAWFIPTYSVCARAVLETGVAGPTHPLVEDAIDTIGLLTVPNGDGRPGAWLDATYHTGLDRAASVRAQSTTYTRRGHPVIGGARRTYGRVGDEPGSQHACLDIRAHAANGTEDWPVTAASIHGAAMALSALRRAWGRIDPREPPESRRSSTPDRLARRRPTRDLPPCPFDRVVLAGYGELGDFPPVHVKLTRSDTPSYEERAEATSMVSSLLRAFAQVGEERAAVSPPASLEELAKRLRTRRDRPDAGVVKRRIRLTNEFFGFDLIREVEASSERFWLDAEVVNVSSVAARSGRRSARSA